MAVPTLTEILEGRGFASWGQVERKALAGVEHGYVELPAELVRSDGSLDVYSDVLKLFQPAYRNNSPVIRCSGWVGYIPLNDRYALEVATRVPIGNLERLISLAAGYDPKILAKYSRQFSQAEDRPASFFDIIADQLLDAFEHLWNFGLLKTYIREQRIGTSPIGRIIPLQSAWRTAKLGRPVAASSAFSRTVDFGANRVLRYAFEKLLSRYAGMTCDTQRTRTKRLRRAFQRLEDISRPSSVEVTPAAISHYVRTLPSSHEHYADALMIAQLIVHNAGISIRGKGGVAILPSILIDMSRTFEDYIRRILTVRLCQDPRIIIKDGNIGGEFGAMVKLFDPVLDGITNPKVTPDIVVEVNGQIRIVIDAKYKPSPKIPDRDDINQIILYGARYNTNHIMILHSERPKGRHHVENSGRVGIFHVYNGMIDLSAAAIELEEEQFTEAIRELLKVP
jgi:5-methylcytosine-specific restriction endonuclease McrBC regulatory subunit McrC